MRDNKIDRKLVESARVFGQWLNQTARVFAENEIDHEVPEREDKIWQVKAKILREFENIAMRAFSPQDMLFGLSRRAGQLIQTDFPNEATFFMDAVMSGEELSAQESMQMIIAYMRLQRDETPKYVSIKPESNGRENKIEIESH